MPNSRARLLLAFGCATVAALSVSACGGTDKKAPKPATSAPESRFAPDAEVATGLKRMDSIARTVSRQHDEAASKQQSERLEPVWSKVEGTVKRNAPDLYATIEEDLSLLQAGAAKKTRLGAQELSRTVDDYLGKHPG